MWMYTYISQSTKWSLMLGLCSWCRSFVFFFKQKTAYEMRISDWSSDVCSSYLDPAPGGPALCRDRRRPKDDGSRPAPGDMGLGAGLFSAKEMPSRGMALRIAMVGPSRKSTL